MEFVAESFLIPQATNMNMVYFVVAYLRRISSQYFIAPVISSFLLHEEITTAIASYIYIGTLLHARHHGDEFIHGSVSHRGSENAVVAFVKGHNVRFTVKSNLY